MNPITVLLFVHPAKWGLNCRTLAPMAHTHLSLHMEWGVKSAPLCLQQWLHHSIDDREESRVSEEQHITKCSGKPQDISAHHCHPGVAAPSDTASSQAQATELHLKHSCLFTGPHPHQVSPALPRSAEYTPLLKRRDGAVNSASNSSPILFRSLGL